MEKQKRKPKLFSRPDSSSPIALMVVSLIYIPTLISFLENIFSGQIIFAVLFSPLLVLIPLNAYKVGISLRFFSPGKTEKEAFTRLIALCIFIAFLSTIIEVKYLGNPIKLCFNSCKMVSPIKAFLDYLIITDILTIPAWFGIVKYDRYDFSRVKTIKKK
jgi:hypothetical protein